MKRLFKSIFVAASFLLLNATAAQTQDLKIGYVDPQVILSRMPETAAVQMRLQNFAEQKNNEFQAKQVEFQQELANYQQKVGVISEEANQAERERLAQMEQDIELMRQQSEVAVQNKRAELLGPVLQQIQEAINGVAVDKGLSYVLNTTTSTGDVIILYATEEIRTNYDITVAVMEKLGIGE